MARVQMGETPGMHRPFFPLLLPLAMFLLEHPPPKKKKKNFTKCFSSSRGSAEVGRGSERVEFGEFQFHIQSSFYIVHGLLSG